MMQNVVFVIKVAFLFNWIGFFLSFCLTTSAAGRYGAISGFGLSLIKWVLIVRVSGCSPLPAQLEKGCFRALKVHSCYVFSVSFKDQVEAPNSSYLTCLTFSFLPTSLVILMGSTGCGGCSWPWVSLNRVLTSFYLKQAVSLFPTNVYITSHTCSLQASCCSSEAS